ncbi:MAG: AMP-binding protein [Rhodospirillaceae bacterium]|nr:AMP-binding protein [Rhodospirillaceae bacterium]
MPTLPDHAERMPDKPACIMAGSGAVITYAELEEGSNRFAHLLRVLGIRSGDHIAIFAENHARYFELLWGAKRAGTFYTAISFYLTTEEIAYIVNDSGSRLFVATDALSAAAMGVSALCPNLEFCLMLDGVTDGFRSYEDAVAAQPSGRIADEVEGTDMLYSSGTTGRPKAIKRPAFQGMKFGEFDGAMSLLADHVGMKEEMIYLSPAPLYHAAPLRYNMATVHRGGTSVIMERFDAAQSLLLIEQYRVTHSQWVPTMFVRMLKLPEEERVRHDLSSHETAIHAAAPCPVPVKEAMIEWWGPILLEYYGGTESNGLTLLDSHEWLTHKGSVGRAIVGIPHVVDNAGVELGSNQIGAIYFSDGPDFEYYNDPERTTQVYDNRGWSTLGDVGYIDEDGYVYLTDRQSFMIISGGVNIYPQEIENVLITHPKVADVAVFGVPNEEFGEEVKAVVQPASMADATDDIAEELITYARQSLSSIKTPRSIDFEEALPRHATGKLYKRLLKDRYWGRTNNRIV